MNFDVAIIGGGSGGYVSAIRAAQLGLKVGLIEKEHMGGTCLNKGCIPTKALLQSAKIKHYVDVAKDFGVDAAVDSVDFAKIIDRARNIISGLNKSVSGLMKKNNIAVINGEAEFLSKNRLLVNGKDEVSAKNIVIATGAFPKMLAGIEQKLIDKGLVWTSKEAIFTDKCPKKMLIIGTGAIGIEFASFYNTIGADITVVEIQDRILLQEDEEIASAAKKAFEKQGMKFMLGTSTKNFTEQDGQLLVEFSDGTSNIFNVCLVAIGVTPNTKNLALDKVGIRTNSSGTIVVDKYNETSVKGVYAIGDVTNAPWLAHKASREGIICAERIAGLDNIQPLNPVMVPCCTYSNPQVASIGLTEQQAKELGIEIKVGRSYFRGNGKALAVGESEGFVKVIFDSKTGELLGAHMIGHEVTELLPIFSLAISSELTETELIHTIFPHPTMSECLQEAVMNAFSVGIHS